MLSEPVTLDRQRAGEGLLRVLATGTTSDKTRRSALIANQTGHLAWPRGARDLPSPIKPSFRLSINLYLGFPRQDD